MAGYNTNTQNADQFNNLSQGQSPVIQLVKYIM